MGKVFIYLFVGAVMFSLAAAGSWLMNRPAAEAATQEVDASVPSEAPEESGSDSAATASKETADEMPVVVRPRPISAEEVYRMGALWDEHKETLRQREETVAKQEKRLKLILDEVKAEQKANEGFRLQLGGTLDSLDAMLDQLYSEHDKLQQKRDEAKDEFDKIESEQSATGPDTSANAKSVAEVVGGMDAVDAADTLREMVNNGDIATVVEIISLVPQRDASAILTEMGDSKLVTEIIEATLNRPRVAKHPQTGAGR